MSDLITVVVIDDHLVTRKGIISLVERNPRIKVVAEGTAGSHVLQLLEAHHPDVLITDLQMPDSPDNPTAGLFEPVSTLQKAIQQYKKTAVLVLSQEHNVQTIQSLAQIGVKGYLLKTDNFTSILDKAVEIIHQGASYFSPEVTAILFAAPRLKANKHLTERQLEVIEAVFRSPEMKRGQLAASMHISLSTLQKHINVIYEVMGVPNMESCIIKAIRMGLIDVEAVLRDGGGHRS